MVTSEKNISEKKAFSVSDMAICGMCIALTFVATAFINIQLPIGGQGGLIHLGNVPLFIAAVLFGRKVGALAGGLGMALFDLMGGWVIWAPCTLITVGLMGYVVGWITEKHKGFGWNALAFFVAGVIKITGYYIAEGIIYGNWVTPILSVPGNLLQIGTAIVIVLPILQTISGLAKQRH